MRAFALLAPLALLAGCTELDDARAKLDEANEQLADARQQAQDVQDRYDRVRSARVAREEHLLVLVAPKSNEREYWFDAAAWRGEPGPNGTAFPRENLTSLPPIRLASGAMNVTCDPLSCRGAITGLDVNVTWADGAPGAFTLVGGHAACATEDVFSSYCAFPMLERNATIRVLVPVADVTS